MRVGVASIGQLRRARRSAPKLTQEQLAELAGVDPQTVQRAETGRTALSLVRLRSVVGTLGVSLAELFAVEDGELGSIPEDPWGDDEMRAHRSVLGDPGGAKAVGGEDAAGAGRGVVAGGRTRLCAGPCRSLEEQVWPLSPGRR